MSLISQYKTSKYITLFSTDAIKMTNTAGKNNVKFSWNITYQNLSANANIGLVNVVANTVENTLFNLFAKNYKTTDMLHLVFILCSILDVE